MQPIFISGIGTNVGKTLVSAILAEALEADYWKPVQAGFENGTDSEWIRSVVSNTNTIVHPEFYRLSLAASPHIAARQENISIRLDAILEQYEKTAPQKPLLIEGPGGLLVPLNEKEFVIDLIKKLDAKLILVSRNYLGSINHSLLSAKVCRDYGLTVMGWIFNDQYLDYEKEIVSWSGIPSIASIPFIENPGAESVRQQALRIKTGLISALRQTGKA